MEVFIKGLDSKTTKTELSQALQPILQRLDIKYYDVFKQVGKTFGNLTVTDTNKAQKLISLGQTSLTPLLITPLGRRPGFHISRRPPNLQLLHVLQKEEKDATTRNVSKRVRRKNTTNGESEKSQAVLEYSKLEIGTWAHAVHASRYFSPYYSQDSNTSPGKVFRRGREIIVDIHIDRKDYELVVDVANVASISLSTANAGHSVILTLSFAPKIYYKISGEERDTRDRLTKLPGAIQYAIGSCVTYRFLLLPAMQTSGSITRSLHMLTSTLTPVHRQPANTPSQPLQDFNQQVSLLNTRLVREQWSFPCKFRVQALWTNGLLAPAEVLSLLAEMHNIKTQSGDDVLVRILQNVRGLLQIADSTQGGSQEARRIMRAQHKFWASDPEQFSKSPSAARDEVLIHRVTITPTGLYLNGPEEIAANRVLRDHRDKQDCFLRVSFTDEDWDRVQFDRDTSNKEIFEDRFLQILRTGSRHRRRAL